jgi:hypothetical protein
MQCPTQKYCYFKIAVQVDSNGTKGSLVPEHGSLGTTNIKELLFLKYFSSSGKLYSQNDQ